jgi:hypothetical protein
MCRVAGEPPLQNCLLLHQVGCGGCYASPHTHTPKWHFVRTPHGRDSTVLFWPKVRYESISSADIFDGPPVNMQDPIF